MENFAHEETDETTAEILRNTEPVAPQESAKTIERATRLKMHPDEYKSMEKNLTPEVEIQERVPANVSPSITNHMSKSSQHANMVKDEVGILETISKQVKYIDYNVFEKFKLEEEITELNNKDRLSENGLEPHEYEYLDSLYEQQQEEIQALGIGDDISEQAVGMAAGVATDMVRSVFNNKALIATTTGIGLALPIPLSGPAALGTAITVAIAKDAYVKTAAGTFGDLRRMKDENGVPLNLPRNTIDNISTGVGLVAGTLEAVTGKVITGGFQKLLTRKGLATESVKRPALRAAMELFGHTSKSAITSGGEEVSAEIASIFGENFARGSKDDAGFLNALKVTTEQITAEDKIDPKTGKKIPNPTFKRLLLTGTVGAIAGGGIGGTTGAVAVARSNREKLKVTKVNEAVKVLNAQNDFLNVAATSTQTELKNMSPEQMSELRKSMFSEAGYEGKIFFNEADLETIAEGDPELAEQIRKLDVTQSSSNDTRSGSGIEPHQFLDLVEDTPTLADYMRMNPEAPNPLESKNFLTRLNDAEAQRQELFESLGVDQEMTPEQIEILNTIDETVDETLRENTVDSYIDDFNLPPSIEEIFPENQLKNFKEAQERTRTEVALQITEEFNQREQRIENRIVRANEEILKRQQLEENKRSTELVEKFKGKSKKEFSPLAIDPVYLPEDLKEAYLNDKRLKSRKAFKEGGVTLEESAAMAGYETGEAMLKDLANAPTVKELAVQRKKRVAEIRKQVKETRDKSKDARLDELFNETSNLHIKEMNIMKNKEWGTTKGGIRRIVLPSPILAEVNNQAKDIINKTKVENVSPKQFNSSERVLQKKYLTHILKNEVEQAFVTKEKALLNSELTRESLRARKRINDSKVLIRRLTSDKGRANLENAGLLGGVDDILSLFDIDPTVRKSEVNRKNFIQYVRELDDRGESITIPESLSDIRQRGSDLTVEQYGKIVDRLANLEHQAKLKNKLLKLDEKRKAAGKLQTVEAIVEEAVLDLQEHPTFNPERKAEDPTNKNSRKEIDKIKEQFSIGVAAFTNLKNVVTELDQEALGGKHYENIAQPLVESETFKRAKLSDVTVHIKNIAEQYGTDKFQNAFNEFIEIKEFADFEDLGLGSMTRSDLWMLLAYTGDPYTRKRIANFKGKSGDSMTVETIQRVLDEHLTEEDAKLAQNFTNIFKSFEEEAKALHLRTTGVEPTMVQGVPIIHRGKVLDGGYVPANYLNTSVDEKIERFLDIHGEVDKSMFGGKESGKLYSALRAAEQTDQGRLIERTSSTRPLDTNFMNLLQGFEEHIHDVAYREAGTDSLKLVKNPFYKKGIMSTVGEAKYETIINGIIETVGKVDNDQTSSTFNKEHGLVNKVYRYFEQGFAINALGFNIKSVAMQPLSLGTASLRMGPKSKRYLAKSLGEAIKNINDYETFFQRAVEINPDLATGRDNIDDTLTKSTYDFIPPTLNLSDTQRKLVMWKDKFAQASMIGLQKVDIQLKAAVSLAAYSQFVNGDVKNFSKEKIDRMTPVELDLAAKKYVKQISDLALTTSAAIDKSAVEKIALMRLFTRFYTDVRSQLNTGLSQGRKIRNAALKKDYKSAAVDASSLMLIYTLNKMYTDTLYDEETPLSELGKVRDFNDLKNWLGTTAMYAVQSPAEVLVGSVPLVRDVQFAVGSYSHKKQVSNWIGRSMSDVAMSYTAMNDFFAGHGLDYRQEKALVSAAGLAVKGLPLKGLINIFTSDTSKAAGSFIADSASQLGQNINQFITENKDVESQQEFIKDLKQIQQDIIPPESQSPVIPENAIESMRLNDWKDVDPVTGAAGVFQFTEERWDEISTQAPELGLTENGRVTKDISQQEKAMEWSLENNAKGLAAYRVDVNIKTLYGAHKFGLDDYAAVELSGNNEKLTNIVENEELFKGFTTVKEVKDFITNKIKTKE